MKEHRTSNLNPEPRTLNPEVVGKHGRIGVLACIVLLALSPAQGAVKTYSIRMPVSAVITESDDTGKTWRRNGVMPVTYVSAVNQIKACLGGQGWRLKETIPLGNTQERTLMNFGNGKLKITVMVWKIKLNQAGFSWGIVE
jgi:hypothetical protein